MYKIKVNFIQKGIEPVLLINIEPGQTVLEIALKNDIELHHNCGGVCSCTTCHLHVERGMEFIDEMEKRERDYLNRVIGRSSNSRLGCQSLLLDGEGEIELAVPDQTLLPDEYYGEDF
jgi:2Fe-2S ferredoxin